MKGSLFIVAAPSGAGKTSLVNGLLDSMANVKISISHTTRSPRPGEIDGVDYFFIEPEQFLQRVEAGDFLEHAQVFGNDYGTSGHWVVEQLVAGYDVILEIDWQGARQVRQQMPDAVGVFVLPPSKAILKERLQKRGQDQPDVIEHRMTQATEEMSHYCEYEYLIINDDFDRALSELKLVIQAQRFRQSLQLHNNKSLIDGLLAD